MEIRKTKIEELDKVMAIYAHARQFMVETGNPNQWGNIKPHREWIVADIENGNSYVCVEKGEIAATFFYSNEPDPTYAQIYDGVWCGASYCVSRNDKGSRFFLSELGLCAVR